MGTNYHCGINEGLDNASQRHTVTYKEYHINTMKGWEYSSENINPNSTSLFLVNTNQAFSSLNYVILFV